MRSSLKPTHLEAMLTRMKVLVLSLIYFSILEAKLGILGGFEEFRYCNTSSTTKYVDKLQN